MKQKYIYGKVLDIKRFACAAKELSFHTQITLSFIHSECLFIPRLPC